eukprot:TRINITY_DN3345_c0_g1_i1.p1 TRINITY_DN3345_c0_g1~~TRINITY_DN3345_c0_g1_i1.p1  ORF type:complete len:219 (+),score=44.68 TRINITY_DN3345_c0_g1_i1:403-1059(+)
MIALETETELQNWTKALKENSDKEVLKFKSNQSVSMRLKKNISSQVATSSTGKAMIKDFLGKDGILMLKIIKTVVTAYETKQKATEVENNLIRLGVKVILLWQNKNISNEELVNIIPLVKELWQDMIHYCDIPYSYDVDEVNKYVIKLKQQFSALLSPHVTQKTLDRLASTMDLLSSKKFLNLIFEDDKMEDTKKSLSKLLNTSWNAVFGDGSRANMN